MEESLPPEYTEALTGKLHELLTDSDNDAGPFPFKEETIEQVMQEFYKEIACPKPPSPSPSLSEPSPCYFPNAKVVEMPAGTENELPVGNNDEFLGLKSGQENEMERHEEEEDEGDFDEEWLGRVLSWGWGQGQGQVVDSSDWF